MEMNLQLEQSNSFNFNEALNRMGGDKNFLLELISDYITDFDQYLLNISIAIKKSDFSEISVIGHTLKGSSATLSMIKLNLISAQIEIAGVKNDKISAKKLLLELKNEFENLVRFLQNNNLVYLN